MNSSLWGVVGGSAKGGILVREGMETTSAELPERLATGAIIIEETLVGERMQYTKVSGSGGPNTGWISTKFKDKPLVVSLMPAPNVWRVMYFETPTRGEQLRLLFWLTGTSFEDVKLPKFPDDLDPYRSSILGDNSPLAFDRVPLVQYNGTSIVQVAAAMQFVGEKLGLVDDTPEARAETAMLMLGSEEMRNTVFYPVFQAINDITAKCQETNMSSTEMMMKILELKPQFLHLVPYDQWMGHFERYLRRRGESNGPFLLGNKISYVDVALYDCITAIWTLPVCESKKDQKTKYPLLKVLEKAVREQPRLKDHLDVRGDFWPAINKVWKGESLP